MSNILWKIEEKDLEMALKSIKEKSIENDYIGSFEIGALSIEFVLRAYDKNIQLDYDVYAGGVDNNYACTKSNKPYDFIDGGCIINRENINLFTNFEIFKEIVFKEVNNYINTSKYNELLMEKSKEPLFDWN